ncbi:MAG: hypothetical protein AAB359_08785, partial [Elusimicrobiota bacterium]
MKLLADFFQFIKQHFEDFAFARGRGNQIYDYDGVVLLTVAVDTAHALLQSCRIPWHIVVNHYPAELKVNAFTSRICTYEEPRPAFLNRLAEKL